MNYWDCFVRNETLWNDFNVGSTGEEGSANTNLKIPNKPKSIECQGNALIDSDVCLSMTRESTLELNVVEVNSVNTCLWCSEECSAWKLFEYLGWLVVKRRIGRENVQKFQ